MAKRLQTTDIFFQPRQAELAYDCSRSPVNPVHRPSQDRRGLFAAWLCLLAVALLYAPLAGAAWSAHALDCCTAGFCKIPEHHHKKAPAPTDCDHGSGMSNCSMSCCQDQDSPVVTAMTFVLPPLMLVSVPLHATRAMDSPHSIEIPRSIQPLLPPPRIVRAVL
jgi:hypothetical protein